jgi:hypothetical protein
MKGKYFMPPRACISPLIIFINREYRFIITFWDYKYKNTPSPLPLIIAPYSKTNNNISLFILVLETSNASRLSSVHVRWNTLFYLPEFGKSSEYDTLNSMSVKFGIGNFSGNGLKTVTSWPLRANSFINAKCTVMWLLAGMGNIPRIFAPSVAYRHDKSIMSVFSFDCRSNIMFNCCPTIISLGS